MIYNCYTFNFLLIDIIANNIIYAILSKRKEKGSFKISYIHQVASTQVYFLANDKRYRQMTVLQILHYSIKREEQSSP